MFTLAKLQKNRHLLHTKHELHLKKTKLSKKEKSEHMKQIHNCTIKKCALLRYKLLQ